MSLDSHLDEEDDIYSSQEHPSEPSPSSDAIYEMFSACQRPCVVVLNRLTPEEIQRWSGVADDRPSRTQKKIAKHYLKDVPRVDFGGLFDQYKRSRQKFIDKKNRPHLVSAGDFGFSSNEEEVPVAPSDDDEYIPEVSHKKKRKWAYEDDDDWSPGMEDEGYSPRPKKTLRNLRVNTRRKRIESNSSSEDEDFEDIYNGDEVSEDSKPDESAGDPAKQDSDEDSLGESKHAKDVGFSPSNILDTDVVSQIMREMEDFHRQKGPKSVNFSPEDGKKSSESVDAELPRPRQKRRISRLKLTDNLTPTIREVQEVVKNMVNSVCSYERNKRVTLEESRKRTCKWCDSRFQPQRQDDDLCKICNDVVRRSTPKTNKKGPKVKAGCSKPGLNKIKKNILKVLPKYEQRRLTYVDSNPTKNASVQQDVPDSNVRTVVAEVHPTPPSDVTNLPKVKKLKLNVPSTVPRTRVIKTKKKRGTTVSELVSVQSLPDKNSSSTIPSKVDNNKKGLLRIDFPGATTSEALCSLPNSSSTLQKIAPKQSVTNNVQFGTYLLPPTPTVVVANYAATDSTSGDYYLSSVYYQNEMTQSKNTPSKTDNPTIKIAAAATKTNSLPSMPSIDQLSNSFLDQLSNNSSLSFTPLEDTNITTGIEAKVVNSKIMVNQVNKNIDQNNFALGNLSFLLNNPNFQIQPVQPRTSSVATTDIASLFSSTQLHIQPLVANEDLSYNLIGEAGALDEANNTGSFSCGEELNEPSKDMPSNDSDDMQTSFEEPTNNEVTSKVSNKSKEMKPTLNTKKLQETSEDEESSEVLFRNMSIEIDAIGILGVVDLDKNPRASLESFIKRNRCNLEQLKSHKPVTNQLKTQIKEIEENWLTLQKAKNLLNAYGSFEKLTKSLLFRDQILQIKKEKNLEQEEEHSPCQFSLSKSIPEFIDIMDQQQGFSLDDIPNIESEISPMPAADLSQFGTVHHFSAPASIPRSESRDTPSRGSGPVTPARPESAMSQVEEPALTPIQIKKERMEAESLASSSQCPFAGPPTVRTPVAANPPPAYPQQQMTANVQHQQVIGNLQQQQQVVTNIQQQQVITNIQQQQVITNFQQQQQVITNIQQRGMVNLQDQQQQMVQSQQQMMQQPQQQMMQQPQQQMMQQPQQQMMQQPQQQMMQQNQQHMMQQQQGMGNLQQQQVLNPQVSMSLSSTQDSFSYLNEMTRRLQQAPASQVSSNNNSQLRNVLIAPNNAQMSAPPVSSQQILHYQRAQPPLRAPNELNISKILNNLAARLPQGSNQGSNNYVFKNGQVVNIQQQNSTQNTNVVYKTTPMVNVQQVYLPSGGQQRYQPAANQYNISVQQGSTQGQLMVNSAGQAGYSFQGQQAAQQMSSVSPVVQSPVVQQQNQMMQSAQSNQNAFLMPNNRVLLFEIQQPR